MANNLLQRIFNQFSTMGADVKNLFSTVGNQSDLTTVDKKSLVRAINEVARNAVSAEWMDIKNKPVLMEVKLDLGSGVDLNSIADTGIYMQTISGNATLTLNYPENKAGMLTVTAIGTFVYQEYWTHGVGNKTYRRTQFNATWYPWKLIA